MQLLSQTRTLQESVLSSQGSGVKLSRLKLETSKVAAFKVTITPDDESTDSESTGLVVQHALSVGPDVRNQWIIDSGATCHMCNQKDLFTELEQLKTPLNVILGDGHILPARGHGKVSLTMSLPQGKT